MEIYRSYGAKTVFGLDTTMISRLRRLRFGSLQNVGWRYDGAERTSWMFVNLASNAGELITTASRVQRV